MHVLAFILFGLVVGAIAKLLMPGRDPGGILLTTVLGMVGALIGGLIGRAVWGPQYAAGWILSIVGAIILLALYRLVTRRPVH